MKKFVVLLALVLGCGCTQLQAFFKKECPSPVDEFQGGYLTACEPMKDHPEVTCCGYGIVDENNTEGDICFHVLCQTACSDWEYVQTICVPGQEPKKKGQEASSYHPSWDEGRLKDS